jgi:hypothetical protein
LATVTSGSICVSPLDEMTPNLSIRLALLDCGIPMSDEGLLGRNEGADSLVGAK